jgi:methyl-accepting chemotaxis protein
MISAVAGLLGGRSKLRFGLPTAQTEMLQELLEGADRRNEALKVAFDKSVMPAMIVDDTFHITMVNEASMQLLSDQTSVLRMLYPSFDPQKIKGACIDIFHKDPERIRNILRDPARLPFRTSIALGPLQVELNVFPTFGEEGNISGYVLEWDDVTQERRNASLLTSIGQTNAVMEFGRDGSAVAFNEVVRSSLGFSKGSELQDIASQLKDLEEVFSEALQKRSTKKELALTDADGGEHLFDLRFSPVLDRSGQPTGFVGIGTEVTELRQAEEARAVQDRRQREELEFVISHLSEALARLADGRFDCEISEAFVPMFEALRRNFNITVENLNTFRQDSDRKTRETNEVVLCVAEHLERLANGDLTAVIEEDFPGDYSRLATDFNRAANGLRETVSLFVSIAQDISEGAVEVSSASAELAQRTEEQAVSLERTASAMTELDATVAGSAAHCKEVSDTVSSARSEAENTHRVVRDAVESMDAIEGSSSEIAKIVDIIDDVAFQTNLLALNAGVEAARAGDAGQGFAVVAQEVRSLAQSTTEAAKRIASQIEVSSEHVRQGSSRIRNAGQALERLVGSFSTVSKLSADIAQSAEEQSRTISSINEDIHKMDQTTQRNAAMVEETTAVSQSLQGNSAKLTTVSSRFKTASDGAALLTNRRQNAA